MISTSRTSQNTKRNEIARPQKYFLDPGSQPTQRVVYESARHCDLFGPLPDGTAGVVSVEESFVEESFYQLALKHAGDLDKACGSKYPD